MFSESDSSHPLMSPCRIFGGPVMALKAAKHKAVSTPAVKAIQTPPPIPMPPSAPPVPFKSDSFTPAKPVLG